MIFFMIFDRTNNTEDDQRMELINATRMVAGCTMGIESSGRELLVIVTKGTFQLPSTIEERSRLAEEQVPLVTADIFTGRAGSSAPLYEADFAPRKSWADILLIGSAYAPARRPATRVPVGLSVGEIAKTFVVVGDRHWQFGAAGIVASEPEPFLVMPITYDRAFGGVDANHQDPAEHAAFMPNPVGRGYHKHIKCEWVDGAPLPSTEGLDAPVAQPSGRYVPQSFGPVGRGWEPRLRLAGTYDQHWLDKHFPLLPPDFDQRYYQVAPLDQQSQMPIGGQEVTLVNLTPDGVRRFVIPEFEAPVHVFLKNGGRDDLMAVPDTVVIEPDHERLTILWRASRPLGKNMHEVAQVLVGRKGREWWQDRGEAITVFANV
jgi:hypothetical protein